MKYRAWMIGMVAALMAGAAANAATIYVGPGETYTTIQAGIDAAVNGDAVIVRDGTYTGAGNLDIALNGKAITVRSEHVPYDCIIDCQNSGSAFLLAGSGETADTVIQGFTITNASPGMGGITLALSSPTIQNNLFLLTGP